MKQIIHRAAVAGIVFALSALATSVLAVSIVNGLYRFDAGDVLSATQINSNFHTLNTRIADAQPVGAIIAWHKSLAGTPALPAGWAECNGQTVSDAGSPYNGQTLPNLNSPANAWNSAGSFLRGGTTSGTFESDSFQGHFHGMTKNGSLLEWFRISPAGIFSVSGGGDDNWSTTSISYSVQNPITGANGPVRFGDENRPVNMSVVWIIKIK